MRACARARAIGHRRPPPRGYAARGPPSGRFPRAGARLTARWRSAVCVPDGGATRRGCAPTRLRRAAPLRPPSARGAAPPLSGRPPPGGCAFDPPGAGGTPAPRACGAGPPTPRASRGKGAGAGQGRRGGLARPAARAQRARGHGPPPESAASLDARSAPHAPSRGAGRAAGVRLHPCHAASGSPSPPGRGGGGGCGIEATPPTGMGGDSDCTSSPSLSRGSACRRDAICRTPLSRAVPPAHGCADGATRRALPSACHGLGLGATPGPASPSSLACSPQPFLPSFPDRLVTVSVSHAAARTQLVSPSPLSSACQADSSKGEVPTLA